MHNEYVPTTINICTRHDPIKYLFFFIVMELQVSEALGLPDIKNRQWSIQETSALKGSGLFEGFDW
jgi:hypothetical protein